MMKKTKVIKVRFPWFVALFWGCGPSWASAPHDENRPSDVQPSTAVAEPEGGTVGDFTLKDIDGKTHVLSDYLGDTVVVWSFFATWCEPCKIELMELRDYYRENADAGFVVLGIAMDEPETLGDVRPFAKQRRLNFSILLDTELEAVALFNPKREAPFVVVIDKVPSVYWSHFGYFPGDGKRLQAVIKAAVEQRPATSDAP